jgi:hypothetical protein
VADVAVQRFTVHLIEPDEVLEVDANRIDLRRFEATEAVAWFDVPASLTRLDKLAYHACVRTGAFAGTWQEFDARAAAVTSRPDPTQGPAGPTQSAATDDGSSDSPPVTGTSRASSRQKGPK